MLRTIRHFLVREIMEGSSRQREKDDKTLATEESIRH